MTQQFHTGYLPKRKENISNNCIRMLIAALFITSPNQKQPKCSLNEHVNEQMNSYIYIIRILDGNEKEQTGSNTLNNRGQRQKITHLIPFM